MIQVPNRVIILTLDQVVALRIKRNQLMEEKVKKEEEMIRGNDNTATSSGGSTIKEDMSTTMDYMNVTDEIKNINTLLRKATIVENPDTAKIGLGTKFEIQFPDKSEKAILLDNDYLFDNYSNLKDKTTTTITSGSAVGSKIKGLKPGEGAIIKIDSISVKVTINGIDQIKEHYSHYLRSAKEKKGSQSIEYYGNINDDMFCYTTSQKALIEDEIEYLSHFKNNAEKTARREWLENYLNENRLAQPPKGNKIGIGSIITLIIADDEQGKNARELSLEMINEAVSTEISTEYIERFSSLGQVLYGQSAGNTFKGKNTGQTITIKSVDNSRAKIYQYIA